MRAHAASTIAVLAIAAVARAQEPCPSPLTTQWDVEAAGCTQPAALPDGYSCRGTRTGFLVTATAVPEGGLDCASLPHLIGGRPNGRTTSCEVVDGIAYLSTDVADVALRAHPDTGRLLMVSTWAEGADLHAIATSIVPRRGLTATSDCTSVPTDELPLELVVPAGVWTTQESRFEATSFVLVDPSSGDRWLRVEWHSLFTCGRASVPDREVDIGGELVGAQVSPGGVISTCIELHDESDRAITRAAFVRFPGSEPGTAFAASILRTARPRPGWTFSPWDPGGVVRRWTARPIERLVIGLGALAVIVVGALVVRARRRR